MNAMVSETGINEPQGPLWLTAMAEQLQVEPTRTERPWRRALWVIVAAFPLAFVSILYHLWERMPQKDLNGPMVAATFGVGLLGMFAVLWAITKSPVATTATVRA